MPFLEVAALLASSILPWMMPRTAIGCSIDKVRKENQKKKL